MKKGPISSKKGFRRENPMSKKGLNKVKIVGITINSTSRDKVLREITQRVENNQKTFVATPNPEFIVFAHDHLWFKKALNKAHIAIPDGIGLILAGKILGRPFKERITGVDLMESLCELASKQGWTVYLLGGLTGVAKKALTKLEGKYSNLKGWAKAGPELNLSEGGDWDKESQNEVKKIVKEINQKKPDLLFVGYTMPKQLKLIPENLANLEIKLAMGVGGSFDYLGGQIPRAPEFLRNLGLEWLYRLARQPWRYRRQLNLIRFGWLILSKKNA